MKLLLSGQTGFLGQILSQGLEKEYSIVTIGRHITSDIQMDLSKDTRIKIEKTYDIVVHAAGKAHQTPQTSAEKNEFFQINFKGTINLLSSLSNDPPKQLVFISTVAVYGREGGLNIDETHPLNGNSAYACSKIKAEEAILAWGKKNLVSILIFRLPLIAGPKPPGNLGKMIDGIKSNKYISINHGKQGEALFLQRIWPHVSSRIAINQEYTTLQMVTTLHSDKLNRLFVLSWGKSSASLYLMQ